MDFRARIPRDVKTQKVRVFVQMFAFLLLTNASIFDLGGGQKVLQVLNRHNAKTNIGVGRQDVCFAQSD